MTSLFSVYKSEYARKRFASSELTYLLGSYLKVDIRIPYSFMSLKELSLGGMLPGFYKASW